MPLQEPLTVLQKYWGYQSFREGQLEIIQSILSKRDTLALLPTGMGKSVCYQVPSLCLDGLTIVISPLIALMQDQVQSLKNKQIFADLIHSALSYRDIDRILDNAAFGKLKLLYVSPERMAQDRFLERLRSLPLNFVAIDEAHCISQWGHDFRPSYLELSKLKRFLNCPILALTATATHEVQKDIQHILSFLDSQVIRLSSSRPNLSLSIQHEENKINRLIHILSKFKNSGLIYVRSRRMTVEYSEQLQESGFKAEAYHAGLESSLRKKRLEDWMNGTIQYMVCTTAFGMGIDKSNVDVVVHMELPLSIEEYYQEVGRAGRGGEKAYAVSLYNNRDKRKLISVYENSFPPIEEIQNVYKKLAYELNYAAGSTMEHSVDFDFKTFCSTYQLPVERTSHAFRLLMQSGFIFYSNAMFIPSKVHIMANRESLSVYYALHPEYELVLVNLLRMYEGIRTVQVSIFENQLAFQAGLKLERVIRILEFLDHEEVIHYVPQRNKSQIQLLGERLTSSQIKLDEKWIQSRKEILKSKIEATLQLLTTVQCRQRFILQYFGETAKQDCGICDNCLKKKKNFIDPEIRNKWRSEIIEILHQQKRLSLRSIFQHFPSNKKHWVEIIIQELVGEKKISRDVDYLCLSQ